MVNGLIGVRDSRFIIITLHHDSLTVNRKFNDERTK